ncbi:MAG: hypothetical protein IPJ48_11565 [Propionivibrio sp.]|uniref:Uncharacterized protein n=1 Tax=Candidatus Propionivibrio dominans TaxID=2954373 RepID=A0A9D7I7U9_9RHOO|nr:hypothetical protein [Candidatus Propionivibrio dominans]
MASRNRPLQTFNIATTPQNDSAERDDCRQLVFEGGSFAVTATNIRPR